LNYQLRMKSLDKSDPVSGANPLLYNTSYKQKFYDPKEQLAQTMNSTSKSRLEQLTKLAATSNQTSLWFSDFNY
jgi:hypothetical protein